MHEEWCRLVFDSSLPISMVRKHRGIISVCSKKTNDFSIINLDKNIIAPMTPRPVSLKYSKGLVLLVVFRNGYRYN